MKLGIKGNGEKEGEPQTAPLVLGKRPPSKVLCGERSEMLSSPDRVFVFGRVHPARKCLGEKETAFAEAVLGALERSPGWGVPTPG